MIRLFRVYYPVRTLVLFGGEAFLVCLSFLIATQIQLGPDSYIVLNYENGFIKILAVAAGAVLCSYYLDMYDPESMSSESEVYFRLLVVVGVLCLAIAAIGFLFPRFLIHRNVFLVGLILVTATLFAWRYLYGWLIRQEYMREQVFVIGGEEKTRQLVDSLRRRPDLGMEVAGWLSPDSKSTSAQAKSLAEAIQYRSITRVIVAVSERRGTIPIPELLEARLKGIKVEDERQILEKIWGKIEVDDLRPSELIFADGFQLTRANVLVRRFVSICVAVVLLVIVAPLVPLIVLAIRLSSPGPLVYRQVRVGRGGTDFYCYKFRTMRCDAEADTGPTWAKDDDPRITPVGRFLRRTRLDEIPQLWNVLKGQMAFVGPRPERPEFVQFLSHQIPYYNLRHSVRPGITGWAQIRYHYGSSIEEAKEKLKYDLYYLKHVSLGLDLLILFHTIKTVLLQRGSR